MSEPLVWDAIGERRYETGTSKGVLYLATPEGPENYGEGVAWSGLINVEETPGGAEPTALYADNIKYLNLISAEDFSAKVECYMYPDEFAECDGSKEIIPGLMAGQQPRKSFGFSYQSIIGNDTELNAHGYKIKLIYGCMAKPSARSYATVNESPEALTFSYDISTIPVDVGVEGFSPTAILTIDSTKHTPAAMKKLTDVLYGSSTAAARLPEPSEVATLLTPAGP